MTLALAPLFLLLLVAIDDGPLAPVPFTDVHVDDAFWAPRLETNRRVTVPTDLARCEETGRIANFARAGGLEEGPFQGRRYDDSDVFKVIEGASYTLAERPDEALERRLDALIAKIAAAQEEDGYLFTARTLRPDDPPEAAGATRWSYLAHSHELYNVGHLYEAAAAHYRATGKRALLDVAVRNAALLLETFGEGRRAAPPGHPEIELGLVKLSDVTGDRRYLALARFFTEARGRTNGDRESYGEYSQDHLPVTEQREAVGHAVRATYLYSAMADIEARDASTGYAPALGALWSDIVERKTYLTGGIGSSRAGEAFGAPYELPNASAYCETCAAVGHALFQHRTFLRDGDARALDVLERIVFNAFLSGVSLDGDTFFYPNPLEWDGTTPFNQGTRGRSPWFDCACCPVNVVRFVPSIPGMAYATRGDDVFVNLFIGGAVRANLASAGEVRLEVRTRYPYAGRVELAVRTDDVTAFALNVRIPGWAVGRPIPGGLYRELRRPLRFATVRVNGAVAAMRSRAGFVRIERAWRPGDVVTVDLPWKPRRVVARDVVRADRGHVALEQGPLVYCIEGIDHGGEVRSLVLPDDAAVTAAWDDTLLGGTMTLRATAASGAPIVAVPYHLWAHRALGPMAVWLPRSEAARHARPAPTVASRARASASHCFANDTVAALNDQVEPTSSIDHELPRQTFWPRRGSTEWVRYDLAEPARISGVEVYWFDDTGRGACRVPRRWRILMDEGEGLHPVTVTTEPGVDRDVFNVVRFPPVVARAIVLEIDLRDDASAGLLEWRLTE